VEEAGDVEPVLRPRRCVQAELLADLLLELGAALAAAERVDRVARKRKKFSVIAMNTVTIAKKTRLMT